MPRRPEQFEEIREKSREKILAAALKLFANKGYAATSIDSIAKKAGISKGLIYNYYKSKKSILLAIFDDAMKVGEQMVSAQKKVKAPHDRMRGMIDQMFDMMHTKPEYLKLLTVLTLQPGVMAETKEFTREAYKKGQEWNHQLTGRNTKESFMDSLMLGALLDGVVLNFILHGDKYPIDAIKQRIIKEYCSPKKKSK
jgi:AcrR family transcriptional regulator